MTSSASPEVNPTDTVRAEMERDDLAGSHFRTNPAENGSPRRSRRTLVLSLEPSRTSGPAIRGPTR